MKERVRYWHYLVWADEGLEPEVIRGPFDTGAALDAAARAFVGSAAWQADEDQLYGVVIDRTTGEGWTASYSNGELEEWAATPKRQNAP